MRVARLQPLLPQLVQDFVAERWPGGGPVDRPDAIQQVAAGIVAPRSATRRATGESAGPDGDNLATSLPRSVTTKPSPSLPCP